MVRKGHEYAGGIRSPDAPVVRSNHDKPLLVWLIDDPERTDSDEIRGTAGMIENIF